ncbi:DgyrCDS6061 [Dimorphilus gyrociliatus]|nr:DgyrCDS6061 [Dimorphilus gyrociliatus]
MLHQVSTNGQYCIVQFDSGNDSNMKIGHEEFHSRLKLIKCTSSKEASKVIQNSIAEYLCQFGVLLLMYSVLLTKGLGIVKKEMEDSSEVLIDSIHGHGSQSLINLLITGSAVTNLWDGEREVCGLKLQGIPSRSPIGFLTQLEHLRYTEVGWNLKNPAYPIWILGSETHLTVLFSLEETLVTHETQAQTARRTFARFDTECNGFITIDKFGDLLKSLNLESAPDYVNIMKSRVDEEGLGIIMLSKFMEEFFPNEKADKSVTKFTLFHVNCLARSSTENKVEFIEGQAEICDLPDVQVLGDTSNIRTCLMTKWPTIELKWNNSRVPSLN